MNNDNTNDEFYDQILCSLSIRLSGRATSCGKASARPSSTRTRSDFEPSVPPSVFTITPTNFGCCQGEAGDRSKRGNL